MEYLPANLILKILEYVPIQNRLKLRRISKQFKEIIDFKIPEQLILYFDNSSTSYRSIKYEKYLNDNNLLIMKDVEFYSTANLLKFKKIKKLKSNLNCEYLISADYFLNLFEELIELYILDYNSNDFKVNLQLKKLKKLKAYLYLSNRNRLKLDTPSLIELKIRILRNVDIIYPDKLLILKIDFPYINYNSNLTELFKFKNLEQLKIKILSNSLTILNRELLERLINLNKLIIIDRSLEYREENKLNEINNFNYKRKNLEITINGLEIDQTKGLNSDNFFDFWIKSALNSSKINKIKLECEINYNEFMNLFNYELPTNFLTKITKISRIHIDGKIEDESKLINLIKRSNSDKLYFCTELSKSFYRQLNMENVPLNNVYFFNKSNLYLSDKETNDFLFNSKIRYLEISKNSISDFKHSIDYLSNCNLENYSNRSIEFKDRYDASINFHIYDNYVSIQIYDYRHALPIDQSEIKLNKIEFLEILNLIRKSLVDDKFDYFKLKFLIDRINSINSSYLIMIKKLFRTYDISEQIFKSNSI